VILKRNPLELIIRPEPHGIHVMEYKCAPLRPFLLFRPFPPKQDQAIQSKVLVSARGTRFPPPAFLQPFSFLNSHTDLFNGNIISLN